MKFTKMHGLGNNYVIFNQLDDPGNVLEEDRYPALSRKVSQINFGIGSDGIILIGSSEKADFKMRIFNEDGSEAKNCGNGLRCVAKYVYDHGYAGRRNFTIETLGGIVSAEVEEGRTVDDHVSFVTVDMGKPGLQKGAIPMQGDPEARTIDELHTFGEQLLRITCISMGNPHAIIFTGDVQAVEVERLGPLIEYSSLFPERVNVGWVQVKGPREIECRVWERGSGITMACGTGACAAVVAATLNGFSDPHQPITVHLPGGDLEITWDVDGHVRKRGEAAYICSGELIA
ncbi:Diaminopimelate epimerase [Bhargavaea cecembensis DSE10]|uniref:Diaminopimelate epimerase n=1 Tax=Bhargavaea cecembensis DSE10 TaxID=1235279 RepID=M7NWH3_9BACL|nr:diaminopimelate epimerase [Bhargavaea cecembensis]EMR06010.1 Diaminopimelate epimerase [Bhargavaea cecembensis DSE10]